MTTDNNPKQAAVLALVRKGAVTLTEAAQLAGTSRQLVRHWAIRAGINSAAARDAYLRSVWRAALKRVS